VGSVSEKFLRTERILLVVGLALMALWFAVRLHRIIGSEAAVARFESGNTANSAGNGLTRSALIPGASVDFRLWSGKRISAYEESLGIEHDAALAILNIPKIDLEVPVFDGNDDVTLNRGVGRIRGTARIGEQGNLGIAGHRDGFFRGLERVSPEDLLELRRPGKKDRYAVTEIRIVTPEDVSDLKPTAVPTLTLVTGFPYYYVGYTPKRYIVTAQRESPHLSDSSAGAGITSGVANGTSNAGEEK
jgi:sortase A